MNLTLEVLRANANPQVGITVTGLPDPAVVSIERDTPEGWVSVRGGKKTPASGGVLFLLDHVPPLNVDTTYRAIGPDGAIVEETITVPSDRGWLCDPLHPDIAIPVTAHWEPGAIILTANPSADFPAPTDLATTIGAQYPVASIGTRSSATNVPMAFTSDPETIKRFRVLIANAGQIVLRGHGHPMLDDVANLVLPNLAQATIGRQAMVLTADALQVRPINPTVVVIWFSFDDLKALLTTHLGAGATFNDLRAAIPPGTTFLDLAKNHELLVGG